MTIQDALAFGIERSDCEILLAFALQKDRTWIIAHPDTVLSDGQEHAVRTIMQRRMSGEPVAFITGEKEFFGRMFHVSPDVLIPRPATEILTELALGLLNRQTIDHITQLDAQIVAWSSVRTLDDDVSTVIDIGTGSGCIAVTLACERQDMYIIATDIDDRALNIAKQNAQRYGVSGLIRFEQGRGLDPVAALHEPFLLISNPPYIPVATKIPRAVSAFEPHSALFSGEEGMDVILPLVTQAQKMPNCRGILLECREEQAKKLLDLRA